jgi:hypothetical protein
MWHCNIHDSCYCIATSINVYVTLQHLSKFMSLCDINKWLCHVAMYFNGYSVLWHPLMAMCNATSINVVIELLPTSTSLLHCNVHPSWWCIATLNMCFFQSAMLIKHCNIHQSSCHIMTWITSYVALWRASKITFHYDIHQWLCKM